MTEYDMEISEFHAEVNYWLDRWDEPLCSRDEAEEFWLNNVDAHTAADEIMYERA